jgi:hypothetical protein
LALPVTATGVNKVYNGNTDATVNLSSNNVAGDTVDLHYTSASFADPNVGTWDVTVTGINIDGADSGNYNLLNNTDTTTAKIIPAPTTTELKVYLLNPEDETYPNDEGVLLAPGAEIHWMDSVRFEATVTPSVAPTNTEDFKGSVTFTLSRLLSSTNYGTAQVEYIGGKYVATLNNI